jgi:hypothetical protein
MKHAPLHVIHKATPLVLAVSGVLELCVSEPQWRGKAVWRHSLLEAAALRAARRRCDKSALRSHPGIPRLSHTSSRCQTAPGEEQLAGRRELKARGAMHHGGLASRRAAEYLEGRRRAGMKAPYCGSLLPPGAPPPSKSATSFQERHLLASEPGSEGLMLVDRTSSRRHRSRPEGCELAAGSLVPLVCLARVCSPSRPAFSSAFG